MDYLIQYITEIQIKYTTAFSKPTNVLTHLLFTTGNGIDFLNGNPVVVLEFNKTIIPFTEYYKDRQTPTQCLEYYNKYYKEKRVSDRYNTIKSMSNFFKSTETEQLGETEQWEKASEEVQEEINSIVFLTKENFFNYDFWYETLTNNLKYFPILYISKNYARVFQINANTEKNLLKISKLITQVYIDFYTRCLNDSLYFDNILQNISNALAENVDLQHIKKILDDLYFVKQTLDLIPNE